MSKIAIIKIGATGDVVRTTVLLRLFINDDITWITAAKNIEVLPQHMPNLSRIVAIEAIQESGVLAEHFDYVISLDDDILCAKVASLLVTNSLFGAYCQDEKVVYTHSANEWFDMGLSSRLGKEAADNLKWQNTHSYQDILFRMLGYQFVGEEYCIREEIIAQPHTMVVGIEARAGDRWPTKRWDKYTELADRLRQDGYECIFFKDRATIKEYIKDIAGTSLVITGDTLGMHIALALRIPVVTLFTCTSAVEIYGYGRMEKIVSPHLQSAFYKTDYIPEAVEAISVEEVYRATKKLFAAS
jgi:heptosyltransferase-2